ncbi:MAG: hypothetical protein JRF33_04460 [Deltaproteobacteria bacterium]|nr:hypothetical protein [Deltaproteobacteria bacterium]
MACRRLGFLFCLALVLSACERQFDPPQLELEIIDLQVTPELAGLDDSLHISFSVLGQMSSEPVVEVDGVAAGLLSVKGEVYEFEYRVRGSEPEDVDVPVTVRLSGPGGDRSDSAMLRFDLTVPALTGAPDVDASMVGLGGVVELGFEVSEPLRVLPRVDLPWGPMSCLARENQELAYDCIYLILGHEGSGPLLANLRLTDLVGNQALLTLDLGVTLDLEVGYDRDLVWHIRRSGGQATFEAEPGAFETGAEVSLFATENDTEALAQFVADAAGGLPHLNVDPLLETLWIEAGDANGNILPRQSVRRRLELSLAGAVDGGPSYALKAELQGAYITADGILKSGVGGLVEPAPTTRPDPRDEAEPVDAAYRASVLVDDLGLEVAASLDSVWRIEDIPSGERWPGIRNAAKATVPNQASGPSSFLDGAIFHHESGMESVFFPGASAQRFALAAGDGPGTRSGGVMVSNETEVAPYGVDYDVDAALFFGGCRRDSAGDQECPNDLWLWLADELMGVGWFPAVQLGASRPSGRLYPACVDAWETIMMVGGDIEENENTVWLLDQDTSFDNPTFTWRAITPQLGQVPRRVGATLLLDYVTLTPQVFLFGGSPDYHEPEPEYPDDLHVFVQPLNGWDVLRVETVNPSGDRPSGRVHTAAAFDWSRGVIVMFGGARRGTTSSGESGDQIFSDTWELDPYELAWQHKHPLYRPPATFGHQLVFFGGSVHRTFLFGGTTATGAQGGIWSWDGMDWTEVLSAPELPKARSHHTLAGRQAADGTPEQVLLMGGRAWPEFYLGPDAGELLADSWLGIWDGVLDRLQWSRLSLPGAMVAREHHSMVWQEDDSAVLFGGCTKDGVLGDCWVFGDGAWSAGPEGPAARCGHAMAHDVNLGTTWLFGGRDAQNRLLADLWFLEGGSWRQADFSGPAPRKHSAMAYDPARQQVVMFGGRTDSSVSNETWIGDAEGWHHRSLDSSPPAREGARLSWDAALGRMVLLGGLGAQGLPLDDLWIWDGESWIQRNPEQARSLSFAGLAGVLLLGGTGMEGPEGSERRIAAPPGKLPALRVHLDLFELGPLQVEDLVISSVASGLGFGDNGDSYQGLGVAIWDEPAAVWRVLGHHREDGTAQTRLDLDLPPEAALAAGHVDLLIFGMQPGNSGQAAKLMIDDLVARLVEP